MFEILTAEQMKKADLQAIAAGIPAISLIETAGRGLAEVIKKNYETPKPVLFLNGPGNNGADGWIAAQTLKNDGWDVRVACTVKKNALRNDAKEAAAKWDGDVADLNSNLALKDTAIVVDCIYGTGYSGALPPEIVTLFDKIRHRKLAVIAADVPSGLNATTGIASEGTLKADLTVAFCRKKIAHVTLPGKEMCGRITVVPVQIPDSVVEAQGATFFENVPGLWLKDFPLPGPNSHKYERGHVLVYGGDKTGAACLAAGAAQRAGAGLVSLLTAPENRAVFETYRPSIMTEKWENEEDFKNILRDERRNTLLLGPGAGNPEKLKMAVETAIALNKSAVLDADFFTVFKDKIKELQTKLSVEKHVLTPHEGEFTRFFGEMEGTRLERACKAAKMANAVVVLKGSDTIIAGPDGTAVINTNAPSTLATAGSGDVLAGFVAGLMTQGMPPFMAACAGVWLHAETARNFGLGLTAEDIINLAPQTLNRLFRLS